jgi:hypothetical protein
MAANFQHMPGPGVNPMMMQQQQQLQQPQGQQPGQAHQLQQMLLNNIQQQAGPVSGWQATVPVSERFGQVWHM